MMLAITIYSRCQDRKMSNQTLAVVKTIRVYYLRFRITTNIETKNLQIFTIARLRPRWILERLTKILMIQLLGHNRASWKPLTILTWCFSNSSSAPCKAKQLWSSKKDLNWFQWSPKLKAQIDFSKAIVTSWISLISQPSVQSHPLTTIASFSRSWQGIIVAMWHHFATLISKLRTLCRATRLSSKRRPTWVSKCSV